MKTHEALEQEMRIEKYRILESIRTDITKAIDKINEPWPDTGPHGKGPFTGNSRETRKVKSLTIAFSKTLGGSAPVEIEIHNLYIPAPEFGEILEILLKEQLEIVNREIEAL